MSIHPHHETGFVCGLFRFADQDGIPLAVSLSRCREIGRQPDISNYIAEAWLAGWDDERIRHKLAEGFADAGVPFDWDAIKTSWMASWTYAGSPPMDEWARAVLSGATPNNFSLSDART